MSETQNLTYCNWNYPIVGLGNVRAVISDRKFIKDKSIFMAELVTATDYYAFRAQLYGRKYISQAGSYRFGFNGMEKDNELKGEGNSLDFGGRIYDSRIGKWMSVDLYTSKHPDLTPYHFAANSPIMFLDNDGLDIVLFNENGKEVSRIVNKDIVKTFVKVRVQYVSPSVFPDNTPMPMRVAYKIIEAPMPGVIEGFSDEKYQKLDYQIAASTAIFNHKKNEGSVPTYTNGRLLSDPKSKVPDLSPNLVKAIVMEETKMGTSDPKPNDSNDATTDVMQANVYYGPGPKQNDWNDSKTQFGLTKGGGVEDQAESINAGIGILYQKGLRGGDGKRWTGGKDWSNAVLNYNGSENKIQYQEDVMKMSKSAVKK